MSDEVYTPARQDEQTSALSDVAIRALIADEFAKREPAVEPPSTDGIHQDAVRDFLAALSLKEGTPV